MTLNYINYNTLVTDSIKLSKMIPRKYDIIIGIPNSGMITAYIIGQMLRVQVINIDEFFDTYNGFIFSKYIPPENHKILLVDDSITSGRTIAKSLDRIKHENVKIDTAVVYTDRPNMNVNYFVRQIRAPRVFQWNILKHGHLKHACIDFDGVLCRDPKIIEDDNKPDEMINHITNAEPYYIPKKEVLAIITNRIEKFRPQTIEWLEKHKVKYKQLIMYPGTANERRQHFGELGGNGIWKGQKCKELLGAWFIESNIAQANQIKTIIHSSVFCTDTMQMI